MKQKRIRCSNLLALILTVSLLNGCNAGTGGATGSATTLSSKSSNFKIDTNLEDHKERSLSYNSKYIVNDDPTEGLAQALAKIALGPVGGAFASWGIGELYDQFNKDYTGEKLDKLLNDMNILLNAINQIDIQLKGIEYDETIIIDIIHSTFGQDIQDFLDKILLGEDVSWNQFVNATNMEDENKLLSDQAALNSLKALINDDYLDKVAFDADIVSGNSESATTKLLKSNSQFGKYLDSQGNATDFISELTYAQQSILYDNIYRDQLYSTSFDDLESEITNYNSNLTVLIIKCTVSLQQLYLIEQTALFLKYKTQDPEFNALSFGEPGILSSNTYEKNKKILDQIFEGRANHLKSILNQNIFSDTPNFQSVYTLLNNIKSTPSKEKFFLFLNVPKKESNEYVQYEWKGVESENPQPEYGGIDKEGVLEAKINNINYQLDSLEDCVQLGNPPTQLPTVHVTFNSKLNRLECIAPDLGGTLYHGGGIDVGDDNKRGLKMYNTRDIMSSSTVQEGNITQDNNTVHWETRDNSFDRHTVYGTVTFDYYLLTPSGKKDVFYDVNFTQDLMTNFDQLGSAYYYLWDTTAQITCHDAENNQECRQLAGKGDIDSASGYSRICIDHHNIVLQDTHGDSLPSVEIKDYANSPC